MGEIWEKWHSPGKVDFLPHVPESRLARPTGFCVVSPVLLDAAGMCAWVELILG